LYECYELKELSTSIGQLTALQKLNLLGVFCIEGGTHIYRPIDDFARVEFVIEGTTYIYQVIDVSHQLHLSRCFELKEVPTSIDQLTTLQKLKLSRFFKLKELFTSISQLTTL